MTYKARITEMYDMLGKGQAMEAFEKFYADNVVVHDNNSPIREGKEAQRKAMEQWFGMIKEHHGSGYTAITADEDNAVTMVESWTEITMQDGNRMKMEEIGVQKWEGDKIVHERFYYQYDGPAQ